MEKAKGAISYNAFTSLELYNPSFPDLFLTLYLPQVRHFCGGTLSRLTPHVSCLFYNSLTNQIYYDYLSPHFNSPIKILMRLFDALYKKTISIEHDQGKNWVRIKLPPGHAQAILKAVAWQTCVDVTDKS